MDKQNKRRLKVDFNLLMSGTWVLREHEAILEKFEKDLDGGKVIISCPIWIPSTKESRLLDYLMLQSQENNWAKVLEFPSLNSLAKATGFSSRKSFQDLKVALRILKRTTIEFHNCFIDTGVLEYFEGNSEIVEIGILQGYQIKREKRNRGYPVKIVFDDNFLAICRYSLGYKLIPYAPIQGLRDTAYALYKWAWRWFNSETGYGERWIGNGQSLVRWYKNELNATGNYKYPSEVLRRVNSAIKQLNENKEVPFYLQLKQKDDNYKIEIYRKDQCTFKREIPFDKLPNFLRKAVIRLIERKKHIREPYALARSMSWRELEDFLKKLVVITVSKSTWEFIEFSIREMQNEREKLELIQTILSYGSSENNEVPIVVEKTKMKKSNALYKLLDFLTPNWRTFIQDAVEYAKEKKILTAQPAY